MACCRLGVAVLVCICMLGETNIMQGRDWVQVEIKLFVAMLVSRFEIKPDAERMPDCTVSEFIAHHLHVQISLKLKTPVMLRMKKRL